MEKLILAVSAGQPATLFADDLAARLRGQDVGEVQYLEMKPDTEDPAADAIEAVRSGTADAAVCSGVQIPYALPAGLTVEGVLGNAFVSETRTVASPVFEGLTLIICPTDDRETVTVLHDISDLQAMKRYAVEQYMRQLLDPDTAEDCLIHADVYPAEDGTEEHVCLALAYNGKEANRRYRISNTKKMCQALKDVVFSRTDSKGTVTIAGAGCGIGLFTIRGLQAVRKADVIVYDSYRDSDILAEAKASCRTIYAGREKGQEYDGNAVNKILIREAQQGCYVVLLTRGDAFASGRGEELIPALQKAEIPYDVIPGISPVLAYPEVAGIPLVCRGLSHSYTVVSVDNLLKDDTDYDVLGSMEDTVILRSAQKNMRTIAGRLLTGGRAPETPAALLVDCYEPGGKTIIGTLGSIARRADQEDAAAILLVGDVVAYNFAATRTQLLTGMSVTVAGTRSYTHELAARLTALGASVSVLPYLKVILRPGNVPLFYGGYKGLVFENGTAVDALVKCIRRRDGSAKLPLDIHLAALSASAAAQMRAYGLTPGFEFSEATEPKEVVEAMEGKFLLVCGEEEEPTLSETLKQAGALMDVCPIYRLSVNQAVLDSFSCAADYIVVSGGAGARVLGTGQVDFGKATPLLADAESAEAFLDSSDKFRYRRMLRSSTSDPEDVIVILAENHSSLSGG